MVVELEDGSKRILTADHVIEDHTFIEVQKISNPNKKVAIVEAISHESDLALLRIEDDDCFTRGLTPATLGPLPKLKDEISVLGYPVRGTSVCVCVCVCVY